MDLGRRKSFCLEDAAKMPKPWFISSINSLKFYKSVLFCWAVGGGGWRKGLGRLLNKTTWDINKISDEGKWGQWLAWTNTSSFQISARMSLSKTPGLQTANHGGNQLGHWQRWILQTCGAPFLIQLPVGFPGHTGGWRQSLGPCRHMEVPGEAPGSWLETALL